MSSIVHPISNLGGISSMIHAEEKNNENLENLIDLKIPLHGYLISSKNNICNSNKNENDTEYEKIVRQNVSLFFLSQSKDKNCRLSSYSRKRSTFL